MIMPVCRSLIACICRIEWVDDPDRRAAAGVPDAVAFQTKPQIALDQLRAARAAGIDAEVVLADAGYGNDTDFRDGSSSSWITCRRFPPPSFPVSAFRM